MTQPPGSRRGGPSGPPETTAPDPTSPTAGAKPRVLVVDDEPSMREMLRIVLSRDGYDVVVAKNGTEGIERLKAEPFDLLLSDIRMPDLSGVDVLRAARQINREIVVFMMTAFASTDTAVEAMAKARPLRPSTSLRGSEPSCRSRCTTPTSPATRAASSTWRATPCRLPSSRSRPLPTRAQYPDASAATPSSAAWIRAGLDLEDGNLAGIRDTEELRKLPDVERKACIGLWEAYRHAIIELKKDR